LEWNWYLGETEKIALEADNHHKKTYKNLEIKRKSLKKITLQVGYPILKLQVHVSKATEYKHNATNLSAS
jgi:CO dehydrogenase/acetyl-CoA synthase gamma subunit (corrinoid Fe-S protein)